MKYPTPATLEKYGLDKPNFRRILKAQGMKCPICEKDLTNGGWNIDHEHIKGWKKMPPAERRKYVRGITCNFCNRFYLVKKITVPKAKNIIGYLESYAIRQKRLTR